MLIVQQIPRKAILKRVGEDLPVEPGDVGELYVLCALDNLLEGLASSDDLSVNHVVGDVLRHRLSNDHAPLFQLLFESVVHDFAHQQRQSSTDG